MDRTKDSGKSKGSGICLMTNMKWCDPRNTTVLSTGCPLPIRNTLPSAIITTAVYIPPHANTDIAISELQEVINRQQSRHPSAASSSGTLTKPNFHRACQNSNNTFTFPFIKLSLCLPSGNRTTCPFSYNQNINNILREAPVMKDVRCWMDQSEALLQLDNVDWEMFCESLDDVGEFAEVVGSYVNLLYCETTQAVKIKVFPNQKPWVLSPLLYNIYTHDCIASNSSTSIIKFADDTVVLGLITNNNKQDYLNQV
ncbi:hypothetical protein N1851_007701 [Merluccius polli]|uniref:Reverse transcriptase domain-containing protein n=1 Tax=Merluccius polli TaxID=89951 RepID=A0AA47P8B7_MERPO|nr:hypothetical protein N1851_007701 [Merluccius polli]